MDAYDLMPHTKLRTASAIAWAIIETSLRQGIPIGSCTMLARLIAPNHFDFAAMQWVLVAFAGLLARSCLAAAFELGIYSRSVAA